MSTAMLSSTPKIALDRTCINIVKAENQSCNVTEDNNNQSDCYESMHAFKKIRTSTSGLRKSPNKWTKEENQKLASLVSSYGEKKWKRISAEMGGQKTGAQCAQHWKRVLSPEIRKGHWDENEEDLLLRLVVQYGSCWKKIAKKIPQRTDIQCRYQYLKAKQSREVMWDSKEDESLIKKVMEVANCSSPSSSSVPLSVSPASSPSSASSSPSCSPNLSSMSMSSPRSMPSPLSMTDSPLSQRFHFSPPSPSPLRNSSQLSPMQGSPSVRGKGSDDSSSISSGSGSGSEEEYERLKMSGEMNKFAWNDDKNNVNMGETSNNNNNGEVRSTWKSQNGNQKEMPVSESQCVNCQTTFISHICKVVWLEISEHMARLKLTSTLRTALECKTRFMELLGNKISFPTPSQLPTMGGLKSSAEMERGRNGLRASGGIPMDSKFINNNNNDNIGVKINNNNNINNNDNKMSSSPNSSKYNGSNINLTNCNHNNITINITNSYTTNNNNNNNNNTLQNGGVHLQQITHSPKSNNNNNLKNEPLMSPSQLLAKAPILSPAPPFPSFTSLPPSFSPHLSSSHHHSSLPSSFPHLPAPHTLKRNNNSINNVNNVNNGLDSLAAVASILPREMLADYF